MTVESQDELIIRRWHEKLSGEIMLKLIITEDKRSEAFAVFCDQLSSLASQVHITKKKSETEKSEKVDDEELLPSPEENKKKKKSADTDKEDIIDATNG